MLFVLVRDCTSIHVSDYCMRLSVEVQCTVLYDEFIYMMYKLAYVLCIVNVVDHHGEQRVSVVGSNAV